MAYITRIVEDVNSDFYYLKERCLTYLTSFVEGLNKDITQFMASNINPDSVYILMIHLIKKLAIYYSLKESKEDRKKYNEYKRKHSYDTSGTFDNLDRQDSSPSGSNMYQLVNRNDSLSNSMIQDEAKSMNEKRGLKLNDQDSIITEIHEKSIRFTDASKI